MDAGNLLYQDLDAYAALFGPPMRISAPPLVGIRGLPPDASQAVMDYPPEDPKGQSAGWVSWAELQRISEDTTTHLYSSSSFKEWRRSDGSLVDRWESDSRLAEDLLAEEGAERWEDRQYVYVRTSALDPGTGERTAVVVTRFAKLRREAVFGGRWRLLFNIMALLATDVGPDNVRLVAWLVH